MALEEELKGAENKVKEEAAKAKAWGDKDIDFSRLSAKVSNLIKRGGPYKAGEWDTLKKEVEKGRLSQDDLDRLKK
jgi:hypothetical protein